MILFDIFTLFNLILLPLYLRILIDGDAEDGSPRGPHYLGYYSTLIFEWYLNISKSRETHFWNQSYCIIYIYIFITLYYDYDIL